MRRSTDRILATHTGSLPRPARVVELLLAGQRSGGALDGAVADAVADVIAKQKAAGIDITPTANMLLEVWKKFVVLSGTSGITASTRQPLGIVRDDADMRAFFFSLMHETIAVGRAAGVKFPPDFPAELERLVAGFSPMMKASMANDLHAGNRLELDCSPVKWSPSDANTVSQRPARKRSTRS